MSDRLASLARNPAKIFWVRVLIQLKTLNAIIVLFYLSRGVSMSEIYALSIVFSCVSLLTEIPSGYLADRFGRVRTMICGVGFLLASHALSFFVEGFWPFALVFTLMALALSCFSGTEEALLYDTLKELGKEKEMIVHNSRVISAQNLPKIFLPFLGAFLAQGLLPVQFQTLILIDAVGAFFALLVLFHMQEPRHLEEVSEKEKGIFRESLTTIWKHPLLFFAALNRILPFVASLLFWRFYQDHLAVLGTSTLLLGTIYVVYHSIVFSLRWTSEWSEKTFGSARVLNTSATALIFLMLAAPFVSSVYVFAALVILSMVIFGLREPFYAHWMHKHIHSRSRATTVSNLNVLQRFVDIPCFLAAAWLSATQPLLVSVLCAALCFLAATYFRIPRTATIDL